MELAIILTVAGSLVFLGNYLSRTAAYWHRQRVGRQELAQQRVQRDARPQARRD